MSDCTPRTTVCVRPLTLTEMRLCRIWSRTADHDGDWWDLFERLTEIAQVLEIEHCPDGAALFRAAADSALDRCIYGIREAA